MRDRLTGHLWLLGREDPVRLDLRGNGHRDMAGCRVFFTNAHPREGDPIDLNALQKGVVGDMTASRKVRVLDVPVEEAMKLAEAGQAVPEHKGNCLYLEWFSEANGRVVIESVDFEVVTSEPAWQMTPDEEDEQRGRNQQAVRDWLDRLSGAVEEEEPSEVDPELPMDEFQWEKFLQESDALTEKYGEALEKYKDHPDCDKLVARDMGWTWLEEALEAEERGALEADDEEDPYSEEEFEPLEPNPITEGLDWIRDERGRVHHPLTQRASRVAMAMWHHCDELDLLGEHGDADAQDMVFQAQTLSAKLAGALDHLAYDQDREPGFVIACLKRSLNYLHGAISAAEKVAPRRIVDPGRLNAFRDNLFEVRERILDLMGQFRRKRW